MAEKYKKRSHSSDSESDEEADILPTTHIRKRPYGDVSIRSHSGYKKTDTMKEDPFSEHSKTSNTKLKDIYRTGYHRFDSLDDKIQRMNGVPGELLDPEEPFGIKFFENEIRRILKVAADPFHQFICMVAGVCHVDVDKLYDPDTNIKLASSIIDGIAKYYKDASDARELENLTKNREDLNLLNEATKKAGFVINDFQKLQEDAKKTESLVLDDVERLPNFPSAETFRNHAYELWPAWVREIFFRVKQDNQSNGGTLFNSTDTTAVNESNLHKEFKELHNSIKDHIKLKQRFDEWTPKEQYIYRALVSITKEHEEVMSEQVKNSWKQYGLPNIHYRNEQERRRKIDGDFIKGVMSMNPNVPPARMEMLGLGTRMPSNNMWASLEWLIQNRSPPTKTDLEIISKMFAKPPMNSPEWTKQTHHLGHIFYSKAVLGAIQIAKDEVMYRCGANEDTFDEDKIILRPVSETVQLRFAHLVAYTLGVSQKIVIGRFTNEWTVEELAKKKEKTLQLFSYLDPKTYKFKPEARSLLAGIDGSKSYMQNFVPRQTNARKIFDKFMGYTN